MCYQPFYVLLWLFSLDVQKSILIVKRNTPNELLLFSLVSSHFLYFIFCPNYKRITMVKLRNKIETRNWKVETINKKLGNWKVEKLIMTKPNF